MTVRFTRNITMPYHAYVGETFHQGETDEKGNNIDDGIPFVNLIAGKNAHSSRNLVISNHLASILNQSLQKSPLILQFHHHLGQLLVCLGILEGIDFGLDVWLLQLTDHDL